jgi:hypothetical protein
MIDEKEPNPLRCGPLLHGRRLRFLIRHGPLSFIPNTFQIRGHLAGATLEVAHGRVPDPPHQCAGRARRPMRTALFLAAHLCNF